LDERALGELRRDLDRLLDSKLVFRGNATALVLTGGRPYL
jgi:hypothetical protein